MTSYPRPMCFSCTRFDAERGGMYCTSFPDGIPVDIVESRLDHRTSVAGEPTFEQNPDQPEPDWELIAMTPPVTASAEELRVRVHPALPTLRARVHGNKPTVEPVMATATSTWKAGARKKAAAKGQALPDGSYPIKDKTDWYKAKQALGRAKNRARVVKHLISRAKTLGIPAEDYKGLTASSNAGIVAALPSGAIGKAWDELLHPRGRNGRFIEKGGFVSGMFLWDTDAPGGDDQSPSGTEVDRAKVVGFRANKQDPDDPFVVIKDDDGNQGYARASAIEQVAGPKGSISDIPTDDDRSYKDEPEEGEGDEEAPTLDTAVGRDALANQGVDPALLDKLSDDEANMLWEKLVHEDKGIDDLQLGDAEVFRRRTRQVVTNHLLDKQMHPEGGETLETSTFAPVDLSVEAPIGSRVTSYDDAADFADAETGDFVRIEADSQGTVYAHDGGDVFIEWDSGAKTRLDDRDMRWVQVEGGDTAGRFLESGTVVTNPDVTSPEAVAHRQRLHGRLQGGPTFGVWQNDMTKVQQALENGGWITSTPDETAPGGTFTYVDPEAPPELVALYQRLVQMGYAKGWIS